MPTVATRNPETFLDPVSAAAAERAGISASPRGSEISLAPVSVQAQFFGNAVSAMCVVDKGKPLSAPMAGTAPALPAMDSPPWLEPTIQAMLALPWDNDNWNDDAAATHPGAAATLLVVLVSVLDDATPPPAIVPTWRGGVQAEWHRNGVDLEIEADPDGALEYYFRSPTEEHEEQALPNIARLTRLARFLAP